MGQLEKKRQLNNALMLQLRDDSFKGITIKDIADINNIIVYESEDSPLDPSVWERGRTGKFDARVRGIIDIEDNFKKIDWYDIINDSFDIIHYSANDGFTVDNIKVDVICKM